MRRILWTATLAVCVLGGGCIRWPWQSERQKFTERLVDEQTRQGAWVGLISHPAASFTDEQIRRAREGTFRPVSVTVIDRGRGSLYMVEAEGYYQTPPVPGAQPPRLLSAAGEEVSELSGPVLMFWRKDDTFVRVIELYDQRAALIELTGDRRQTPELLLWSRTATVGETPTHSKLAVFDLDADLTRPQPPMLSLVVEHAKLDAGRGMLWRPLEAGRHGIVLYEAPAGTTDVTAGSRVAVFEWDRRHGKFSGPTGGGAFPWSRVD